MPGHSYWATILLIYHGHLRRSCNTHYVLEIIFFRYQYLCDFSILYLAPASSQGLARSRGTQSLSSGNLRSSPAKTQLQTYTCDA